MRRRLTVPLVGVLVIIGMMLPTVNLSADTPKPVAPTTHQVSLRGVHSEPDAPRTPPGYRIVALTEQRSVPEYSVLGVTWRGNSSVDLSIQVRTRHNGTWSSWTPLLADGDDRPEVAPGSRSGKVRAGTAPYYAGESDGAQVLVASPRGRSPRDLRLDLIDPGTSAHDDEIGQTPAAAAHGLADRPTIISRWEWGADESLMTWDPERSPTLQAGFVHHTAGANDYTREEVPAIIRGIYAYHAETRGWGDIGYNFLVDRFGRTFEGRYGGADQPIIGGHAYGFNANSFGVAALGTYETTAPSTATLTALSALIAWKLEPYGRDPLGSTVMNDTTLSVISGHRDAGSTECPGQLLYDRLSSVRSQVATLISREEQVFTGDWDGDGVDTAGKFDEGYWTVRNDNTDPDSAIEFTLGRGGDVPVVGDWNGDGRTDIGVFRSGWWYLKMGVPGGLSTVKFQFGTASDTPVVGDWDGDGRDEPGVFRDGQWRLNSAIGDSTADLVIAFGQAGDSPMLGDWDGDGDDTPAVRRGDTWYLKNTVVSGDVPDGVVSFGQAGDSPVSGNWNSGAADEIGVVRTTTWYLRDSLTPGTANQTFRM